ncbi:MAG TPA: hypothetical protein DD618_01815 [Acholeplasmatales bacterium]|nr:hypothetical protein [Acholeplasmatales bacterium]
MNTNDSMLEIALRKMKSRRNPRTIAKIAKDVFEEQGFSPEESEKLFTQFHIDFMLSGYFICCGEDKNGVKLWDLKNRQPSSLLDKDGNYLEDLYSDDEEVLKNELTDDTVYPAPLNKEFEDETYDEDEDEDEEKPEHDDIEEDLLSEGIGIPEGEAELVITEVDNEIEDDTPDDEFKIDEFEIEEAKKNKENK